MACSLYPETLSGGRRPPIFPIGRSILRDIQGFSRRIPAEGLFLKDLLRSSYDRSAAVYDGEFRALQRPKYEALFGPRAEALDGITLILDLGCGTGLLAEWLAGAAADARRHLVVGVDLSARMLARARNRGVLAVQGDIERLPVRAGAFRAAAAITSIGIGRSPRMDALAGVAQALAKGGLFAVSVLKEVPPEDMERDLRRAGFLPGPRIDCGQDWGWRAILA